MSHVGKTIRNGKVRWRARYRDPSGHLKEKWFDRKIDAQRFLALAESGKLRGDWVDPALGKRTFGDYADEWLRSQVFRGLTQAKAESDLRVHIVPALGARPLGAIRPTEVQAFVRGLSETLAPSTTQVVYRRARSIFAAAVKDGLIAKSPCVDIRLPRSEPAQVRPLSAGQVWAIHDAMPARWRAMVVLAAGCGLRQGEVLGLVVDNVKFLERVVIIGQQMVKLPGQPPAPGPLKTPSSYRTVPAPDVVVEALARHVELYPPGPDGLLFTTAAGAPIGRQVAGVMWRDAARKAGVPDEFSFHALRHFYASSLIARGASVTVVQHRLGHATAAQTLNVYSHLWPDDEELTRVAMEGVLRRGEGRTRGEQITS